MNLKLTRWYLLLSILLVANAAFSQVDENLEPLGGRGGGYFVSRCAPDEILNGFELHVADDVDWIRAICAKAVTPTAIESRNPRQESAGGAGGSPRYLLCPQITPVIAGMEVGSEGVETEIVNNIHLYCSAAAVNQRPTGSPTVAFDGPKNGSGSGVFSTFTNPPVLVMQQCPEGLVPVGINGRSGKWLDAVGLVCGALHLDLPKPTAPGRPALTPVKGPPFSILVEWPYPVPADFVEWFSIELWKDGRWVPLRQRLAPTSVQGTVEYPDVDESTERMAFRVCSQNTAQKACSPEAWYHKIAPSALVLRPNSPTALASVTATNNKVAPPSPVELDALAKRGADVSKQDPLAAELRKRITDGTARRGFDIGMGAWEGNAAPGPGKQRFRDALSLPEQQGFDLAAAFSLPRNKYAAPAGVGAAIGRVDPTLANARNAESDVFYWLGFDIATGIFGNPKLGASGNTAFGPGAAAIRNELNAPGQRGFNASMVLHLGRHYQ